MKHFQAHGTYQLSLDNQVIVLKAYGGWNKEAAQQLFADIEHLISKLPQTPFAKLIDARQWQLGTPDFQYLTKKALQSLVNKGLSREVYIVQKGTLKKDQLKLMCPSDSRYQRKFVETAEEAIAWLHQQGFSCSQRSLDE